MGIVCASDDYHINETALRLDQPVDEIVDEIVVEQENPPDIVNRFVDSIMPM